MEKSFEELSLDIINHYFEVKGVAFEKHLGSLGYSVGKHNGIHTVVTYKSSGLQVSEVEINIAWKRFDELFPTFEEWIKAEIERIRNE